MAERANNPRIWLPILAACFALGCGTSNGDADARDMAPSAGSAPSGAAPTAGDGALTGGGKTAPASPGAVPSDLDPMPESGGAVSFACPAGAREKRSGAIDVDQTWKKGVYEVDGVLDVTASLTLEAGVVLCFTTTGPVNSLRAGIEVAAGGALRALGTRDEHVVLTAKLSQPTDFFPRVTIAFAPGSAASSTRRNTDLYSTDASSKVDWSVYASDPTDTQPLALERVGIHHGRLALGDGGLTEASRVGIYEPTYFISASARAAARLSFDSIVVGATRGNEGVATLAVGGQVTENVRLKQLRLPYYGGHLVVAGPAAPVLTIEAGVTMVFYAGSLEVGAETPEGILPGDLVIEGTKRNPVLLGCVGATSPGESRARCWGGVKFIGGPFKNTRVRGAILEGGGRTTTECTDPGSLLSIRTTPGVALPDIEGTTFAQLMPSSPEPACAISVICTAEGGCDDGTALRASAAKNVFTAPAASRCNVTCP